MNEFLSELARRAPHIGLAFLAAKKGGPMALAALEGGMQEAQQRQAEAQQRQEALARQAQLDEERRAAQVSQEARLANVDTRAQEEAEFRRRQAAIETLYKEIAGQRESAVDAPSAENTLRSQATGLEQYYKVPSGQLAGMVPNMAPSVLRQKAKLAEQEYKRGVEMWGADQMANDGVTLHPKWNQGQPLKPSQLREMFMAPAITMTGEPAKPYVKPPTPLNTDKRGFITKDVTVNGQRTLAGFDPDTNQYYAPGNTKTPLTGDIQEYNKPQSQVSGMDTGGPESIADAIIAGEQPPTTTGLYRYGAAVRAILAKKGFNLAQAESDWRATQKHLSTLNSAQQLRMHQAVDNASHSLDVIEDLAKQWNAGRFPLLNRGRLAAAKQGALGKQAQEIAIQLDAQIADVTSELGNVYMGGNSPTDHSLSLAAKNLQSNWSLSGLQSAIELSRKNLRIRSNSMKNVGVSGASDDNPYVAPSPASDAGPVEEWVRDPRTGTLVKRTR